MADNEEKKKFIKCGDCGYYMSNKCALFGGATHAYDGCPHGKKGGLHPDIARHYKNHGY